MAKRKKTHVVELTVTRTIVTERWGCDSSDEALNLVISEYGIPGPFSDMDIANNRDPGSVVIEKAVAYEHPQRLMKQCGVRCYEEFVPEERREQLKQMIRNQEHNFAAFGAWMIEHDPDWAIVKNDDE